MWYVSLAALTSGKRCGIAMKKRFSASLWREGDWFVAQCLDVDVASQGRSEDDALANLKQALELYIEASGSAPFVLQRVGESLRR